MSWKFNEITKRSRKISIELVNFSKKKIFHSLSFLKYSSGIDNGSIIDQKKFSINQYDTAKSLHYKNLVPFRIEKLNKIIKNKYNQVVQKEHLATYYPKKKSR